MADSASDSAVTFQRQKRSIVWNHFEKKKKHSVCKYCGKSFVYYGGTSNLRTHLKNAHPSVWPTADSGDEEDKTSAGTKSIKSFYATDKSRRVCSNAKSEALTNLVVDWISENSRPISIVEDTGLKRMFAYVEPGYRMPSRTQVMSMVKKRHTSGKKNLCNVLQKKARFVAVTTDAWTSKAVKSFATYTVHFIDNDWSLQSYVLATRMFDGRHTADNVKEHFCTVVKEFVQLEKITCVVHDEASNMVAAGKQLHEEINCESTACAAHMLQTCLRHSFDSSQQIQKLLTRARKLVGHFHHSTLATEALYAHQLAQSNDRGTTSTIEQKAVKVIQDVSTRWNSSFYMLQRLVRLKLPIMAVLEDESVTPKPEHRALLLKDKMWALADDLIRVLSPAERATALLGAQSYVTLAFVLPIVSSLVKHLAKEETKAAAEQGAVKTCIKNFCSTLSLELKKKFGLDPINPVSVLSLAAALDPRSRGLTYLNDDNSQAALKQELLQRMIKNSSVDDEQGSKEKEAAPPPKKKKKSKQPKGKDYELEFFFGGDSSDKECPRNVLIQQELNTYFAERPPSADTEPLSWWKVNATRYPTMSELAKQLLCIPATSVPSERVFSAAGYIVSKLRAALSPENVDALLFLRQNKSLLSTTSSQMSQETFQFQYSPEDVLPEEIEEIEGWSESELSVVET